MRKLLVFLLLFGSGLALLWWLERGARAPARPEETSPTEPGAPGGAGEQGGSLSLGGRFEATHYDPATGRALLRVTSEDSSTEGDTDVLERVTLELLDPADGGVEATIKAAEARLQRKAGTETLRPAHESKVALKDVAARFLTGVPMAPLEIHAPEASVDATDPTRRLLESEGLVRFQAGNGDLTGEGRGAHVDVDHQVLELGKEASVELLDVSGGTVRLVSLGPGPLQVRREGAQGSETLVVEVWNGASLELSGDTPSTLLADHVLLRATPPAEGVPLRLQGLDADGRVTWNLAGDPFHGGRIAMTFDAQGELADARLEELPSVQITLSPGRELLPGVQPPKSETVLLRSEGAIVLHREATGTSFDAGGPVTIETEDATLRSNGDVQGSLSADGSSASFRAGSGVVLDGPGSRLETAVFALDVAGAGAGGLALHGIADEGSRIVGKLDDGRPFTLTSPGRLEVLRREGALRIVEGTGMELAVEGREGVGGPMQARADRVSDFVLAVPSFLAEGAVRFSSDDGNGSGDVLRVDGPRRFTLTASPPARARLESARGQAEADRIEVDGDRVHARGTVVARVSGLPVPPPPGLEGLQFDRYDIDCDELDLARVEELANGARTERFELDARGAVRSQVVLGTERCDLRCAGLEAERTERFADPSAAVAESTHTKMTATEVEQAHLRGERGDLALACTTLEVERDEAPGREPEQRVRAHDSVRFQLESRFDAEGLGDELTLDPDRTAHLEARPGRRVHLNGSAPEGGGAFELEADRADVSEERLEAVRPEITARDWSALGQRLVATQTSLELTGNAHFTGTTPQSEPWTLDADSTRIEGRAEEKVSWTDLRNLRAAGDVRFRLGTLVVARGEALTSPQAGILRFEGAPARIETPYIVYEAEWMEFDPVLRIVTSTGRGSMRPRSPSQPQGVWTLEFISSSTLLEPDSLVYVLQEPYFRYVSGEELVSDASLRASWSVLWIDRRRWQQIYTGQVEPSQEPAAPAEPSRDPMRRLFGFLEERNIPDIIREVYFEGPVEALSGADQVARADAIYLDLVTGHGWLANTTVTVPGRRLGQDFDKLIIKADWLRHFPDGSLRANSATVTTCSFDEPHVKLVTGDLRITPVEHEGKPAFEISLADNRVELYNVLRIPLAKLEIATDREFKPLWQSLRIADSARFGQLLSFRFTLPARPLGRAFDALIGRWFDHEEEPPPAKEGAAQPAAARAPKAKRRDVDANYHIDAAYLSSRGGLLDLGVTIEARSRYWFDFFLGSVYDTGEDKGYIRVPEDDRGNYRRWMRAHGTFDRGTDRWSLAYSDQSDLGVQSEFFESQFLDYEQDETYLQWKRRQSNFFAQVSVKPRVDPFRTDIEEYPSTSAYVGRAPLFRVAGVPVLYTGDARADYLQRREGSETTFDEDGDGFPDPLQSPFGLPATFPDGLGNREVARFDTRQTLEAPIRLPFLGLSLTPFASARATAWSESVDSDQATTRFVSEGGVRLGTTFWKALEDGRIHEVAPYARVVANLSTNLPEPVVPYDEVENAVFGNLFEVGARSRFFQGPADSLLDLDLRGSYATNRSDGAPDGWLPLSFFGRMGLVALGIPLEAWEDLRYDIEQNSTVYSLFSIGTHVDDRFGIQVGHQLGRDPVTQEELFDAATIAGFYRWTEKWEFEARQAISLLDDTRLDLGVIVRRFAHDAVFEIETSVREGEGTSFSISVAPLLGYHRNRIGYIRW